jgi:A/G-specific adenine glycosylase
MLQQTTVTAVKPYYDAFLKKFPTLSVLAQAPENQVLESWAGLGYYSRARNLHRAAKEIHRLGVFPTSASELEKLPGFGPYTSRAVATFAFNEKVGVLDGNVIRLLSRLTGQAVEHWKPKGRSELQTLADQLAQLDDAHTLNQALIELGATLCIPQNPTCLICPWLKKCQAQKNNLINQLPLKKPKMDFQIWLWKPQIYKRKGEIGFVMNDYLPFLKGQWILPGQVEKLKKKPKQFDLKHGITKYDIYIQIQKNPSAAPAGTKWIKTNQIKKVNPSNLIQKVLLQSSPS